VTGDKCNEAYIIVFEPDLKEYEIITGQKELPFIIGILLSSAADTCTKTPDPNSRFGLSYLDTS